MEFQNAINVHAPIERVFECIEHPELLKRWQVGVEDMVVQFVPESDSPVGTQYVVHIRQGGRVEECQATPTEFERPRLLAVSVGNSHFRIASRYMLSARGDGTDVVAHHEMSCPTLLGKVLSVLFAWLTRRILRNQMDRLKALAEIHA